MYSLISSIEVVKCIFKLFPLFLFVLVQLFLEVDLLKTPIKNNYIEFYNRK